MTSRSSHRASSSSVSPDNPSVGAGDVGATRQIQRRLPPARGRRFCSKRLPLLCKHECGLEPRREDPRDVRPESSARTFAPGCGVIARRVRFLGPHQTFLCEGAIDQRQICTSRCGEQRRTGTREALLTSLQLWLSRLAGAVVLASRPIALAPVWVTSPSWLDPRGRSRCRRL